MPEDLMRYDLLAQNALKGVVRDALRIAESSGSPRRASFLHRLQYEASGRGSPRRSRRATPREMTIVLQHQYWNLHVHDDRFEVELSFDNVPEQLVIPFDAVKGFLDPAVQFGLQFETVAPERKLKAAEPAKEAAASKQPESKPEPARGGGECRARRGCEGGLPRPVPQEVRSAMPFRLLFAALTAIGVSGAAALAQSATDAQALAAMSDKALMSQPAKKVFGAQKQPTTSLKARAIGSYAKGCMAGGKAISVDGPAWQVMRLSRNRNWGHPDLVKLVERLAVEAKENDGWNGLLVGDLAQPRGGPMLSGHASHQVGLDADIWLTPMPNRTLSRKEREEISATIVTKDRKTINKKVWSEAHARLIKRAASYPEVARIFVHPPIKAELCKWAKGDTAWLAKVRPISGTTTTSTSASTARRIRPPARTSRWPRRRTARAAAMNSPIGWATSPGRSPSRRSLMRNRRSRRRP